MFPVRQLFELARLPYEESLVSKSLVVDLMVLLLTLAFCDAAAADVNEFHFEDLYNRLVVVLDTHSANAIQISLKIHYLSYMKITRINNNSIIGRLIY